MSSDTTAIRWTGWLRRRRGAPWEVVCTADGLGACSRLLGEIGRRRGVKDRDLCLTTGAVPEIDAALTARPPAALE
jgi:hypothetical protein